MAKLAAGAAAVGLVLLNAVPSEAVEGTTAWKSVAGLNCFESKEQGFKGGEAISEATNPIIKPVLYMSVKQCIEACEANEDCSAIVMQNAVPGNPTCWLRRGIDLSQCSKNFPDFDLWLRPGKEPAGLDAAYPAFSYPATYCKGVTMKKVPSTTVERCETMCRDEEECEAVNYERSSEAKTHAPDSLRCQLMKDVKFQDCEALPTTELRLVRLPAQSSDNSGEGSSGTGGDGAGGSADNSGGDSGGDEVTDTHGGWPTVASTNCYAGVGGSRVTEEGLDPAPGHLLLDDCQKLCVSKSDCQGIVMADQGGHHNNCWLRRDINLSKCETNNKATVWFKPGLKHAGAGEWISFAGKNCYPGFGADYAVEGEDVLEGHKKLIDCEKACKETAGCEAIVWHDTRDATSSNCYLRKHVKVADCHENNQFNLRLHIDALKTATDGGSGAGSDGGESGGSEGSEGGSDGGDTDTPAPRKPWPTVAEHNCVAGKGAESVSAPGFDPVPGHLHLQGCQAKCAEHPDCAAIEMHDNGRENNCWLRKSVDLSACEKLLSSTVWFKPGEKHDGADEWVSYAGVNCYPGMGGDYAVDGQDVLPGHKNLVECEQACKTSTGCEAIVWHDTHDNTRPNCYLRKNVKIDKCHANPQFNLRLDKKALSSATDGKTTDTDSSGSTDQSTEPLEPWPTLAAKDCSAAGGESIGTDGFDPVIGHHLSLDACQKKCREHDDCEAVVMKDNGHDDNCWLRKNIDADSCESNGLSTTWFKPGGEHAGADDWVSYAGVNCYPGRGAEYAVVGEDVLPGHKMLTECEKACKDQDGCEGIVWHDTRDTSQANCYLRKHVKVSECHRNSAFNLRLISTHDDAAGVAGDAGGSAKDEPGPDDGGEDAGDDAGDDAGGATGDGDGGDKEEEDKDPEGWPTESDRDCTEGNGGDPLSADGFDPFPDHLHLEACQAKCDEHKECEAVVMRVLATDKDPNCWLRKNMDLDQCDEMSGSAVWFKPSVSSPGADDWVSYAGIKCDPGKGADYAVDGQDALDEHVDLGKCEEECAKVQCEGFIWHDTSDSSTPNCHLRTNIKIKECEPDESFNLRLRVIPLFRLFNDDTDTSVVTDAGASSHAAVGAFGSYMIAGFAAASVVLGAVSLGLAAKRGRSDASVYQMRSMVRVEDDLEGEGAGKWGAE